jgi:uncharacterized RDD family membrane protein YckC
LTVSDPPRNAGIVSRSVAAVIDLAVVLLLIGLLYFGWVLTALALNPSTFRFPHVGALFSTTVTFGCSVLYLTGCWAVSGCTVGAAVMGLRVTGRRGQRLPAALALLRAVACVAFPVGLAWVVVDAQRRSLQDLLLGSRVGYVSRPSS